MIECSRGEEKSKIESFGKRRYGAREDVRWGSMIVLVNECLMKYI